MHRDTQGQHQRLDDLFQATGVPTNPQVHTLTYCRLRHTLEESHEIRPRSEIGQFHCIGKHIGATSNCRRLPLCPNASHWVTRRHRFAKPRLSGCTCSHCPLALADRYPHRDERPVDAPRQVQPFWLDLSPACRYSSDYAWSRGTWLQPAYPVFHGRPPKYSDRSVKSQRREAVHPLTCAVAVADNPQQVQHGR